MKTWIISACSGAVLALAGTIPAMAQQTPAPTGQQQQAPAAPSANYSDAQLKKFVGASDKIALVRQEYNPKLQAAPDQSTQQKVIQEANQKMVKVVHDSGMTVDEFNSMSQSIQNNPSLLKRAQDIERTSNSSK